LACGIKAPGGNQKGNSPQAADDVAVTDGLFTVNIDFGPAAIDGTARWLEITVRCPGDAMPTTLTPRQELKPAPHAVHAENAARLKLPYVENVVSVEPMIELTQTGDGPAAIFKVQPQPEPPLPQPAVEAISETGAPALKAKNEAGGAAATFDVGPNHLVALPAVQVTNSGIGQAIEAVSGTIGPPESPTIKATNVGAGSGLEVSSGELSVSGSPTISVTNIGVGTGIHVSSTTGSAIHAVSGNNDAGYFEGAVAVTGQVACASLAWGASALGDDQGGAIELGNSLMVGTVPYIDFHRGVGFAQDFNVRLQNDANGELKVEGGVRVTGTLEVEQSLTVSGELSLETGGLTLASGDLAIDNGDLTLSGRLAASSSGTPATMIVTNSGSGPALHVVGMLTKEYTMGTSNQAAPIAYATINADGSVAAGTPNVSSAWDVVNQRYLISIVGETYDSTTHVTTVTPIVTGTPDALFATTGSGSGQLRVRIMSSSTGTTGLQRAFQFMTFKP
jgi:hypothetical protein